MVQDERPCDVDDLLCQTAALAHLKGLKEALGSEKYKEEFPELQGVDEKIASRETKLREDLARCGLPNRPVPIESKDESGNPVYTFPPGSIDVKIKGEGANETRSEEDTL